MSRPSPRRASWAVVLALAAGSAAPLSAQALGAGALVQSYVFGTPEAAGLRDIRLVTFPVAFSVPVGSFLEVGLSGAFADGRATGADGSSASLAGLTDTELFLGLGGDRAALTLGVTLPSGTTELSLAEAAVAGVVATEFLPFARSSWGSGGGAGADLAVAFGGDGWGVGLSGGYQVAQEYEPLADGSFAYRPGDQLRARLALDRTVGRAGTFGLILGFQRFGEDAVQQANLFRSGDRLEGMATLTLPVGLRGSAQLHLGAYHRENGILLLEASALDGATDSPGQQLLTGGATLRLPAGASVVLLPSLDGRVFRTDDGVGQGWLVGAGLAADLRLAGPAFGRHLVLSPRAGLRLGRAVVSEDAESGLTGWEAGLTLRLDGGR